MEKEVDRAQRQEIKKGEFCLLPQAGQEDLADRMKRQEVAYALDERAKK